MWSDYRLLLASGQLARRQTEYERHLLMRGELLMQIKRSQAEYTGARYVSRLLWHAQQYALLPTVNDAYWNEHFADRAKPLNGCIRSTAVRGRTHYASIWDAATEIYARTTQYPVWANTIAATDDANSAAIREAEHELVKVRRLLAMGDLKSVDSVTLKSLTDLTRQLEQMLEVGYARVAKTIEADAGVTPEQRIAKLTAIGEQTACVICKSMLTQRADAQRAALVPIVETPAVTSTGAPATMPGTTPATETPAQAVPTAQQPAIVEPATVTAPPAPAEPASTTAPGATAQPPLTPSAPSVEASPTANTPT